MEIISTQKFLRLSPRKIRPIVSVIKKLNPVKAVEILPHIRKRGSLPLKKVIQTAISNAKDKGVSEKDLTFKEIQINEGPSLKRGRAVSRGRWHSYKRRTSHIRVVLQANQNELKSDKLINKNIEKSNIKSNKSKISIKK